MFTLERLEVLVPVLPRRGVASRELRGTETPHLFGELVTGYVAIERENDDGAARSPLRVS